MARLVIPIPGAIASAVASSSAGTATVTASAVTSRTGPYSTLSSERPTPRARRGTFVNVGTAGTSLTFADSGLTARVTHWYRTRYTGSAGTPATVNSTARSYTPPSAGFFLTTCRPAWR